MNDVFYDLAEPSATKIKKLFRWAEKRSFDTHVEYLDCRESLARQQSDMPFLKAVRMINKEAIKFFRVIHRGFFADSENIEIAIRNLNLERKEYFIYSFLTVDKLKGLKAKFKFEKNT